MRTFSTVYRALILLAALGLRSASGYTLSDTFDNSETITAGSVFQKWTFGSQDPDLTGEWSIVDGELTQTGSAGTGSTCSVLDQGVFAYHIPTTGTSDWENYVVQARAKTTTSGSVGLAFRVRKTVDGDVSLLVLDVSEGCIRILEPSEVFGTISRPYLGGKISIERNEWYTLRVVVSGTSYAAYVNTIKVYEGTEPTITGLSGYGGVGLYSSINTGAYFDDLQVTSDGVLSFTNTTYHVTEPNTAYLTVQVTGQSNSEINLWAGRWWTLDDAAGTTAQPDVPDPQNSDYKSQSPTSFAIQGGTTIVLSVDINDDNVFDTGETILVQLALNDPSSFILGEPSLATIVIQDDGDVSFEFSSSTYQVTEGDSVVVTITRRALRSIVPSVQVQYQGSGPSGAFTLNPASPATFTFGESVTVQTVTVDTIQNTVFDSVARVVEMSLPDTLVYNGGDFPASGYLHTPTIGVVSTTYVTIVDDGDAGTIGFKSPSMSIEEANTQLTVTLTREGLTQETLVLSYTAVAGTATRGSDFTVVPSGLLFPSGATEVTFTVTIRDDGIYEYPDEVFNIVVEDSALNGPLIFRDGVEKLTANVTILDDGDTTIAFVQDLYSFSEDAGTVLVTVTRLQAASTPRTAVTAVVTTSTGSGLPAIGGSACQSGEVLACGTTDKVDYREFTGRVVEFLTNDPSDQALIPIEICQDQLYEAETRVKMTLGTPSPSSSVSVTGPLARRVAEVAIVDDGDAGTVHFTSTSFSVAENAGQATVTITRVGGSSCEASLKISSEDGTASADTFDYTSVTEGTFAMADHQTVATFTIEILNDDLPESPDEYFIVRLDLGGLGSAAVLPNNTAATPTVANVTILDDGDAGIFSFQSGSLTLRENDTLPTTVTVTRTGRPSVDVTVRVTSGSRTATSGADFAPLDKVLLFRTGNTTSTFTFNILNDDFFEDPDEWFALQLSEPTPPASVGDPGTLNVTIVDDGDVTLAFDRSTYSVREDGQFLELTVTRLGHSLRNVSTSFRVLGSSTSIRGASADFEFFCTLRGEDCELLLHNGARTAVLNVSINNDNVYLSTPEFAVVELTNPVDSVLTGPLARPRTTFTVIDDGDAGTLTWASAPCSLSEGTLSQTLTVTRTHGDSSTVGVLVTALTSEGTATKSTDYTVVTSAVTFGDRVDTGTVLVNVLNDYVYEFPDETFVLKLSGVSSGATLGNALLTCTIVDDGDVDLHFTASEITQEEAYVNVTVTVTRLGSTAQPVFFMVAAMLEGNQNPATLGADYTLPPYFLEDVSVVTPEEDLLATMTIPAGSSSATFYVTVLQDDIYEPDEDTSFELSEVRLGSSSATVRSGYVGSPSTVRLVIQDDGDAGTVAFDRTHVSVFEWEPQAVLTVNRVGNLDSLVTVRFASGNAQSNSATSPSDYVHTAGSLTFANGISQFTIPVTINDDDVVEVPDETFLVTLTQGVGGPRLANSTLTITIKDDGQDVGLGFTSTAPSVPENVRGGFFTVTVTRVGAPQFRLGISYQALPDTATSPDDFIAIPTPRALEFLPTVTSQTFAVQIINDAIYESDERIKLLLSSTTSPEEEPFAAQPVVAGVDAFGNLVDPGGQLTYSLVFRADGGPAPASQFQVVFGGETSSTLTVGADADAMRTALEAMPTVETVVVSRSTFADGVAFEVTFPFGNWTTVLPTYASPSILWNRREVQRVVFKSTYEPDNTVTGQFRLRFEEESTSFMAVSTATDAELASALEALSNVGSGDVAVTVDASPTGTAERRAWSVTFTGSLSGDQRELVPLYTRPELQYANCTATSGSFSLAFGTSRKSNIAFDSTASELATVIQQLGVGPVTVRFGYVDVATGSTVSPSAACTEGGTIISVQFDAQFNDVPSLTASTKSVQTEEVQWSSCVATGGSFTLSFNGESLVDIPYNTPASFLQVQLQSLPSINEVTVSYSSGNVFCTDGSTTNQVTVTFHDVEIAGSGGDLPDMQVDATNSGTGATANSGLVRAGFNSSGVIFPDFTSASSPGVPGVRNDLVGTITSTFVELAATEASCRQVEVQAFSCRANEGYFSVNFTGSVAYDIPFDATSSELKDKLDVLDYVNAVGVTYSSGESACTLDGSNVIEISFDRETLSLQRATASFDLPALQLDNTNGGGGNGIQNREVVAEEVQSFECMADAGSITIHFVDNMVRNVSYSSTAEELRAALASMSKINDVDVVYSEGSTMCAPVSGGVTNNVTVKFTNMTYEGDEGNLPLMYVDATNGGVDELRAVGSTPAVVQWTCSDSGSGGIIRVGFELLSGSGYAYTAWLPYDANQTQLQAAVDASTDLADAGYTNLVIAFDDPAAGVCGAAPRPVVNMTLTDLVDPPSTIDVSIEVDNLLVQPLHTISFTCHRDNHSKSQNDDIVFSIGSFLTGDAQSSPSSFTVSDMLTLIKTTAAGFTDETLQWSGTDPSGDPLQLSDDICVRDTDAPFDVNTLEITFNLTQLSGGNLFAYTVGGVFSASFSLTQSGSSNSELVMLSDPLVSQVELFRFADGTTTAMSTSATTALAYYNPSITLTNFTGIADGKIDRVPGTLQFESSQSVDGQNCGPVTAGEPRLVNGTLDAGDITVEVYTLYSGVATCSTCEPLTPPYTADPERQVEVFLGPVNGSAGGTSEGSVVLTPSTIKRDGVLSGTLTSEVFDGAAAFKDVKIDISAIADSLRATMTYNGTVRFKKSADFNVVGSALNQLQLRSKPVNQAEVNTAGSTFSATVALVDTDGVVLADDNSTVIRAFLVDGPSGAVLHGTLSRTVSMGVATFTDLQLTKVGRHYVVRFNASTTPFEVDLPPIDVTLAAAPYRLELVQSPTTAEVNLPLSPQPRLRVLDQYGNFMQSSVVTVTASSWDVTLGGQLSAESVRGIVQFTNLTLQSASSFPALFRVDFNSTGLAGVRSAVVNGSTFTPDTTVLERVCVDVNATFDPVFAPVVVVDVNNTNVTNSTSDVVLTTVNVTLSTGAILSVPVTANLPTTTVVSGYNVTIYNGTLFVTDTGCTREDPPPALGPVTSVEVILDTSAQDVVVGQPISVSVRFLNEAGQQVTKGEHASLDVHAVLADGPASAVLSGVTRVSAAAGVAQFDNLTVNVATSSEAYQLKVLVDRSDATALTSAFSAAPSAFTDVRYLQQPSGGMSKAPVLITPTSVVFAKILDDGDAGTLSFVVSEGTIMEGDGSSVRHTLTVTRTGGSSESVVAEYVEFDERGTAVYTKDYTFVSPSNPRVGFQGGEILKTFAMVVLDDDLFEYPDERAVIKLQPFLTGTNINEAKNVFNLTILDDGDAGTLEFTVDHYNQTEGRDGSPTTATITVSRTNRAQPSGNITVEFETVLRTATANVDFNMTSGLLVFGDKQSYATFAVTIQDDEVYEYPDEEVSFHIFDVRYLNMTIDSLHIGSPNVSTLTILDDGDAGTLDFFPTNYFQQEGINGSSRTHVLTVTRTHRLAPDLTVEFRSLDNTAVAGDGDYEVTSGRLWFDEGLEQRELSVLVLDDAEFEYPDETFFVQLHTIQYLNQSVYSLHIGPNETATVTIGDDGDAGTFVFDPSEYSVRETTNGTSELVLTVQRVGRVAGSKSISVDYGLLDGTATMETGDFRNSSGTITIGDGQLSQTFSVFVLDDDLFEFPDEVFYVELFNPVYNGLVDGEPAPITVPTLDVGEPHTSTVTILDDGDYGYLGFSPGQYALEEGGNLTQVVVTMTVVRANRTRPSGAITVDVRTRLDVNATTAQAADFESTNSTLSFADGETNKTFTVVINDDFAFEYPDEHIAVVVSDIRYGGVPIVEFYTENRTGTVTILDDGDAGTLTFDPGFYSIEEHNQTAEVTLTVVRIGRPSFSNTLTVGYRTESGTALTTGDLVPFCLDVIPTSPVLNVSNVTTNGTNSTNVTDAASGASPPLTTVLLPNCTVLNGTNGTNGTNESCLVNGTLVSEEEASTCENLTYINNTQFDYTRTSGRLSFDPGYLNRTLVVTINDDNLFESPDETFSVILFDVQYEGITIPSLRLGSTRVSTVTILDDGDAGTLVFADPEYYVREDNQTVAVTVTRVGRPNPNGAISVSFRSSDGTATLASQDYRPVSGTLDFADGEKWKTFLVSSVDDLLFEFPDEYYNVSLHTPTYNGKQLASLRIGEQFYTSIVIVDDGDAGTLEFALDETGRATVVETNPLTLVNGTSIVEVTVTRTGPAASGLISVDFEVLPAESTATENVDYVATMGRLTFADGVRKSTIYFPVINDAQFECPDEYIGFRLYNMQYRNQSSDALIIGMEKANVTIVDDGDAGRLKFVPLNYQIAEGGEGRRTYVTLSVTRFGLDSFGTPIKVDFRTEAGTADSADDDYLASVGTLRFDAETLQTFNVTVLDDFVFEEPNEEFIVHLFGGNFDGPEDCTVLIEDGKADASVTILDDGDAGTFSFSPQHYSVDEHGNGTVVNVTLTRTGRTSPSQQLVVQYATVNQTADSDIDYPARHGLVTFADGQTNAVISMGAIDDQLFEYPDETYDVVIESVLYKGATTNNVALGENDTAVVTIVDDGDAGTFLFSTLQYEGAETTGGLTEVVLTVTRVGRDFPSGNISVVYSTVNGTAYSGSDYLGTEGELFFKDGQTVQTFQVTVLDDNQFEVPDQFFTVQLTGAKYDGQLVDSIRFGENATVATVTITDDGDAGSLTFLPTRYSGLEGTSVVVSVSRVGRDNPQSEIRVEYRTLNGTAHSSEDFSEEAGELVFGPGVVDRTVEVALIQDTLYEYPDEWFFFELRNVTYQRAPHYSLTLDGVNATSTVTIEDDGDAGTFYFDPTHYSIKEGIDGSTVLRTLSITRVGGSSRDIHVRYRTYNGTALMGEDFVGVDTFVTFEDGTTEKNVTIEVLDDFLYEYPDESFSVRIVDLLYTNISADTLHMGEQVEANVTILDDGDAGTLVFWASSFSAEEGNFSVANVTLTVTRVGRDFPSQQLTVQVASDAGHVNTTGTADVDYASLSATLSFGDGQVSQTVVAQILDDTIFEYPDDRVVFLLSDPRYEGQTVSTLQIGAEDQTTLTILDDGDGGTFEFVPTEYWTQEGEGAQVTLLVSRTGRLEPSGPFTVRWSTTNETAFAGEDYLRVDGDVISFSDKEKSKLVVVDVLQDDVFEYPDEVFRAFLHDARYADQPIYSARIGSANESTSTIRDDGDAGTLAFLNASYSVLEGNFSREVVTMTVTRLTGKSQAITVRYASIGKESSSAWTATGSETPVNSTFQLNDFNSTTGVIEFADQETLKLITVEINDDELFEWENEEFGVYLYDPRYNNLTVVTLNVDPGANLTTCTILDDGDAGLLSFIPASYSVAEGNGTSTNVTITVSRTNRDAPSGVITVDFATSDLTAQAGLGNDFVGQSGTLTFGDQVRSMTVVVEVLDDQLFEYPDEEMKLTLSNPQYLGQTIPVVKLTSPVSSTVTILDDGDAGTVQFSLFTSETEEQNGSPRMATVTVTRVGRASPSRKIRVMYSTFGLTATPDQDFTSNVDQIEMDDRVSWTRIEFEVLHDDIYEYPDETFGIQLFNITYNHEPVYSMHMGVPNATTITIRDDGDAGTLEFQDLHLDQFEGDGSPADHTVTVTRVGRTVPSGNITVRFFSTGGTATSDVDFNATSGTLTFLDEQQTSTFVVTVLDDLHYEKPDEELTLSLHDVRYLNQSLYSLHISDSNVTTLTILDDGDGGTMAFAPLEYSIMEGNGTSVLVTLTVTRFGREVPTSNFSIKYQTLNGTAHEHLDLTEVADGELIFLDGETVHTFAIEVLDDNLWEYPDETFNVFLRDFTYIDLALDDYSTRILSSSQTSTVTIIDDGDAGTLYYSKAEYSMAEGYGSATTVTLSITRVGRGYPSGSIAIQYATQGTADSHVVAGTDYEDVSSGVVLFPDGMTSNTFTITVLDDNEFEYPDETFLVRLFNVTYNHIDDIASLHIGSPSTSTITILDDGDAGTFRWLPVEYDVSEPRSDTMHGGGSTTTVTLTVTRTYRSSGVVVVYYETEDGTASSDVTEQLATMRATAGNNDLQLNPDFVASSGTVTFADTVETQTMTFTIKDDVLYEYPDETFRVLITNVTYLGLPVSTLKIADEDVATVTILDDGDAGCIEFQAASYSFQELGLSGRPLQQGHGSQHLQQNEVRLTLTRVGHTGAADDLTEAQIRVLVNQGKQRSGELQFKLSTIESGLATAAEDFVGITNQDFTIGDTVHNQEPSSANANDGGTVVITLIDDLWYNTTSAAVYGAREDPDGETFSVLLSDIRYVDGASNAIAAYSLSFGTKLETTITLTDDGDLGTLAFCRVSTVSTDCSEDPNSGLNTAAMTVANCQDSDQLECARIPEGITLFYTVNENSRRGVFAVQRRSASGLQGDVTVQVTTSDPLGTVSDFFTAITAGDVSLEFKQEQEEPSQPDESAAWQQRVFQVTVVDDETITKNKVFLLTFSITSSTFSTAPAIDSSYQTLAVYIVDDDGGAVVFCQTDSPCYDSSTKSVDTSRQLTSLPTVDEGGDAAYYTLMLKTDPRTAPVTIHITPLDDYEVTTVAGVWSKPDSAAITFTSSNFATPQRVYLRAKDDATYRGESYVSAIQHTAESVREEFDEQTMQYDPDKVTGSLCSTGTVSCLTGSILDNDGGLRTTLVLDNDEGTLSLDDVEDLSSWKTDLINDVCRALNIDCSRVRIVSVTDT